MKANRRWGAVLALALSTGLGIATAQDETADDGLYRIEVEADARIPEGRSAFLQGEADATGHRFLLGGLDLDDPIAVSVFTQNPGETVRVRLVKDSWDIPERDEQTNDRQRVDFKFRTFDDFKIWITADQPTAYQLVVWVGDKVPLPVPSIAVPAGDFVEGRSAASPPGPDGAAAVAPAGAAGVSFSYLELALIAALLLVIIAFGAFLLMRRKPVPGA